MFEVDGEVIAEANEIWKGEGFVLMPNPNGRRKRVEFYQDAAVEVEDRRYGGGYHSRSEPKPAERVMQHETRECGECAREFLATHPDASYCQQACYRRRRNRHKREKKAERMAERKSAA